MDYGSSRRIYIIGPCTGSGTRACLFDVSEDAGGCYPLLFRMN